MRRPWLGLACAALVTERAAPLNPLRRLLRRPPPVTDARYEGWKVDVEAYERADPRVVLQESPGAGTGAGLQRQQPLHHQKAGPPECVPVDRARRRARRAEI